MKATKLVVVAFVVVALVAVRAEVETELAISEVIEASVDENVSATPDAKCPTDEKNDVVVAAVPVAFANVKFWRVDEPLTKTFVADRVPVATRFATERSPDIRPPP